MDDYEIITRLGGGSFSEVFKAKEKSTGEFVAIKVLKKKYTKWEDCLELRECKSLQKLNKASTISPGINHIIKLKQIIFIKESGTLNLVFEYCEKDLYELMKSSNKKMSETQIRAIMHQTLLGLSYMHKYGFFHRDMKPENLLLLNEVIKIADFGLAREIRSVPPYTEYVSTRYYRAPECILKSTHYNSPIDIWAIGCIMAEMYLHPQPLFFGNNEKEVFYRMCSILGSPTHNNWSEGIQLAKMCNMKFPNFSSPTNLKSIIPQASDDAIDLMNKMLKWDPNDRMTANNLLMHPFFTNYVISQVVSTPDTGYSNVPIIGTSGVKKYSNKRISKRTSINSSSNNINNVNASKNSLSDFSKVFNDTKGFENLINNLKSEKNQIDQAFDEQIKKDDEGDEFEFEESLLKSKTNFNISDKKKNEEESLKNKRDSFREIIKKKNNNNDKENNFNNNSNNENKNFNNNNAGFNGFYFGRKNNNLFFGNNKNNENNNNLDFSSPSNNNNNNNNINNRRKLNDDYLNKNKIEENDNDDDDDLFSSKNKLPENNKKEKNIDNNDEDEFFAINKKKTNELYSNNNMNSKKILFGERRVNILQKSSSTNKYEFSLPMNHNLNNDFGNLNNNNNNNNDFFSSFNKRNINRDNFNNNNNTINNKIYDNLPPRHHSNLANNYYSSSQKNINNNNSNNSNNNSNDFDNDLDHNNNKLDFDTAKHLKPNINNNPSRRSARKFLEETENKILENNNNFNFNFDNILSRRNNNNNINNNNNLFENRINNNIDMNIGNLAFGYRENKYNFSNNLNNNNNNNNLFGLPNINSYKFNINNDSGGNKFFAGNRRRYMNSNGNNYSNFDF